MNEMIDLTDAQVKFVDKLVEDYTSTQRRTML
jgi:hypothetical protein